MVSLARVEPVLRAADYNGKESRFATIAQAGRKACIQPKPVWMRRRSGLRVES